MLGVNVQITDWFVQQLADKLFFPRTIETGRSSVLVLIFCKGDFQLRYFPVHFVHATLNIFVPYNFFF